MLNKITALVAVAALTLTACSGGGNAVVSAAQTCIDSDTAAAEEDDTEPLGYADVLTVGADHASIDMPGEEDDDSGLGQLVALTANACMLDQLNAPTYVVDQMLETRSLDGRQSTSWGEGVTAEWSYHPDNGLDVLYFIDEA